MMSDENNSPDNGKSSNSTKSGLLRNTWFRWGLAAIGILVFYFVYVEIQTRLGEQVLNETGLELISLEEALEKAQAENKEVLVDISAIWCPTCRRLDKEIFSNEDVKTAMHADYVYTRLEYESDEAADFMQKYAVDGFPTLVILDNQGNKIKKLKLTFDPSSFIAQL